MKIKLIIRCVFLLASAVMQGQEPFYPEPLPHLELPVNTIDLGMIPSDTVAGGELEFINSGEAPLVITQVFSECGCTVSDYSKDPVEPGEKGVIRVSFNSKGRGPGDFKKALRIRSNADNKREIIFVKGTVKRKYRK